MRKYFIIFNRVFVELNFLPSRTCGWDPVTGKDIVP